MLYAVDTLIDFSFLLGLYKMLVVASLGRPILSSSEIFNGPLSGQEKFY